jgi:hypothetical protein
MTYMKISKRSWHYRYLRSFMCLQPYEIRDDLCGYVRQLLVHVLLLPLYGSVLAALFVGRFVEMAFGSLVQKVATVFARPEPKPSEEKESLIGAWLRAKKDKICPLVEFTE